MAEGMREMFIFVHSPCRLPCPPHPATVASFQNAYPRELCMRTESPRAKRFLFAAPIEVTNMDSGALIRGHTSDLSLFGCRVESSSPMPSGAKVRIRVVRGSSHFVAYGRVTGMRQPTSFGIVFTGVDQSCQLILEKWISELRSQERATAPTERQPM